MEVGTTSILKDKNSTVGGFSSPVSLKKIKIVDCV
jgi:hypothetical protein